MLRIPLLLFPLILWVHGQTMSKTIIDFCSPTDPTSCGIGGKCVELSLGNRCQCPNGFMGRQCARPCQDVYKSCARWKSEERCHWTRPISPFFADNCALSCGQCRNNGKQLALALPPILDNIEWFVGRWESRTSAPYRFPEPMSGPYKEILDVQISEVPAFDRPPVNISIRAESLDGTDVHVEFGFLTSKPFHEDTGFVELNKPDTGDDLVSIELVTNTGLMLIEEGTIRGTQIRLETKYKKAMPGVFRSEIVKSKRMFNLITPTSLEERVVTVDSRGVTSKWLKRYKKVFNYMTDLIPTPIEKKKKSL
ncbi:hypothetical protein CAEBREN_24407 [Caenorhabditis brenneri]|uniref:EGF-like domain-containing protein n=1 Tax=Caenorhabditis brenneri TaxID=135651 RepID=G0NQB6_CAEBE|nr:hypothetical protein CAEBREN_24407 [Caenorhabditis brenneri]